MMLSCFFISIKINQNVNMDIFALKSPIIEQWQFGEGRGAFDDKIEVHLLDEILIYQLTKAQPKFVINKLFIHFWVQLNRLLKGTYSNKHASMIFLDKQFYVSTFTEVLMNILDAQEMVNVEKFLLSVQLHPNYTFTNFDSAAVSSLRTFSSSFFLIPNKEIKQQIQKLMANTDNIITVKKDQPNSSIKFFAYTIFALIFPTTKLINNQLKMNMNDSLLQTLKCSIYSKDINFNQISSKHLSFDNLQAKGMIAQFFSCITKRGEWSNVQRIKFIQWSLQTNNILYELFIRFYRIILTKVGIEGAQNYYQTLGFEETINNLIQYFDIHYRCFKQCFLISEENYFIAETKEYIAIGEYFENQIKKNQDKKSHQIQSIADVKRASSPKRQGVISNDVKLFNFILDSGIHEKENDTQTPHFTDSNYEFAFGRKKKDQDQIQRQEQLKKEFQRLIMNSSTTSIQENQEIREADFNTPPTPFLGGEYAFTKIEKQVQENFSSNKIPFVRKPTFHQSPIHQLSDENFDTPKINPESSRHKNIVSVKDKQFTTFSPQVTNGPRYECFTNLTNDALFIEQENIECFKSSSGNLADKIQPFLRGQCKCLQVRKKRNLIVSRVMQFINFPISRMKNNYTSRSPKFVNNLKFSQNLGFRSPQIRVIPAKQKQEQNLNNANRQARKPAFLKFLKKGKQRPQKYSASSRSISKSKSKSKSRNNSIKDHSPANREKSVKFELDKQTLNKINSKIAKYSAIYNKESHQNRFKEYSQSTSRKNESSSANKRMITQQGTSIKKFDSKYMNSRPALGNNWKSSSNFHQPHRQRKHTDYVDYFDNKKRQTMKVYAPVNIIAPTLYFNGNYQRDNNVVFKVNDMSKNRPQFKQGQRMVSREEFMNNQEFNRYS